MFTRRFLTRLLSDFSLDTMALTTAIEMGQMNATKTAQIFPRVKSRRLSGSQVKLMSLEGCERTCLGSHIYCF